MLGLKALRYSEEREESSGLIHKMKTHTHSDPHSSRSSYEGKTLDQKAASH